MHLMYCDRCTKYTLKVVDTRSLQQSTAFTDHSSARIPAAHLGVCCLPVCVLQKVCECGGPTRSAHPARFSPDDKFSKHRVTLKKRFNILPTQLAPIKY